MQKKTRSVKPVVLLSLLGLVACHTEKAEVEEKRQLPVTSPLRKATELTREYVAQIRASQQIEVRALERVNRAAIEAQYRSANARQLQAVFSYERTLLQSFTEVANLLATYENVKKRYELERQQVEALKQSVEVSNVLFQSARADSMDLLLARRDSLDAELELIETKRRLLHAMVNLYQALGGGWEHAS